MKVILNLIFGTLFKKLDGYKTYIGGVSLIMAGIIGLAGHYYPDVALPFKMEPQEAMESIGLGITACGFGHKAEKFMQKDSKKES